jgi:hypothetical protein
VALSGTLGDFSLADILQLIGLQRKTGLLVLQRGEEQVKVGFENGRVVSAETSLRAPEGRIGQYLLRSGKLTEQRLEAALREQEATLQRLGHLLVEKRWIDRETIRQLLTLQVSETVYELFRWRDGEYDFQPGVTSPWDREFVDPIACETLLMQGAQMVDEWPLIERVIPSAEVVLQPTARAAGILATGSEAKEGKGTVYEQDLDFGFIPADPLHEGDGGPRLGERERTLLRWIDGQRTVGEVAELAGFGRFVAFKTLAHLVEAKMVEPVASSAAVPASAAPALLRSPLAARVAGFVIGALALLGALAAGQTLLRSFFPGAPALPLPATAASSAWLSRTAGLEDVRRATSSARMVRVERGLHVYYLDTADWPETLDEVVERGFLPRSLARDPWGRPYRYEVLPDRYRIAEAGPTGGLPPQSIERALTSLEKSAAAAP